MKFVKYWLPFLSWAALIFVGSSLPAVRVSPVSGIDFLVHKSAHLLEYAILAFLFLRVLHDPRKKANMASSVAAILFTLIYGASDEFHQSFVPGREARLRDIFIDVGGGLLGVLVWRYLPEMKKKPSI